MKRQEFIGAILVALAVQALPASAQAQSYPVRPIRIITPFPAGQGPDVLLRNLAEKLGPALGQPVIIENKPGGSGFIAFQAAKNAAPDGHTLVHMDSFHVGTQPHLFNKLPYSVTRDFEPITPLVRNYFFLVVPTESKFHTVDDLIAAARSRPSRVSYGSWGIASPGHLGGLMLEASTGVQMTHVPYKESSQLYTGVATGETQWAIGSPVSAGAMLKAGKVRFLAVTGPQRIAGYDKVPTAAEVGGPEDWHVGGWNGLLAPKGTSKEIIRRLNAEIIKVMQSPEIKEKLNVFTYEPYTMAPTEMAKLIDQEQAAWRPLIQKSRIKLD